MRFGRFTFDPASGELRNDSGVNRLPPQIAAVLALLTGRPGEVVTRTELRDALWPDTTVEFDQGLNFCIRQLRIALDDDAEQPRFIETLPRRGYRFIAAVERDTPAGAKAPGDEPPPHFRRPAIVGAVVLALAGLWFVARGMAATQRDAASLAIIAFDVPAGDTALASYSSRLAEEMVTSITRSRSKEIAVMGPSFTRQFPGTRTHPDSVRAALHATHLLSGTLTRADGGIRVFAQVIRLNDRRHVMASRQVDSTNDGARLRVIADSIARGAAHIVQITIGAGGR